MPAVILRAHYDGEHIVLDEPFELQPNAPLAVTVLPPTTAKQERERADWAALGVQSLARAYGDDEPEYSVADLRLIAGIKTGREQAQRGEGMPAEDAHRLVDTWAGR
jgi:hypothetical protein